MYFHVQRMTTAMLQERNYQLSNRQSLGAKDFELFSSKKLSDPDIWAENLSREQAFEKAKVLMVNRCNLHPRSHTLKKRISQGRFPKAIFTQSAAYMASICFNNGMASNFSKLMQMVSYYKLRKHYLKRRGATEENVCSRLVNHNIDPSQDQYYGLNPFITHYARVLEVAKSANITVGKRHQARVSFDGITGIRDYEYWSKECDAETFHTLSNQMKALNKQNTFNYISEQEAELLMSIVFWAGEQDSKATIYNHSRPLYNVAESILAYHNDPDSYTTEHFSIDTKPVLAFLNEKGDPEVEYYQFIGFCKAIFGNWEPSRQFIKKRLGKTPRTGLFTFADLWQVRELVAETNKLGQQNKAFESNPTVKAAWKAKQKRNERVLYAVV